jgi:hypothetical protein
LYRDESQECWPLFTTINEKAFEYSGVENIIIDNNTSKDIYNLNGVCIKHNASESDIKTLLPGMYIVGGKKIFVE